ncbi:hypothetical protein [Prosthecobacter sp.]|uniref:hypothetical protein n=1 Tax=Prosthecobacter sp. TaxID=1965333 RepID=UPI003784F580
MHSRLHQLLFILLTGQALAQAPAPPPPAAGAAGTNPNGYLLLRLKFALQLNRENMLQAAEPLTRSSDAPLAATMVREAFVQRFITGTGGVLPFFRTAESMFHPFGSDRAQLSALIVNGGTLPASHEDAAFRTQVKQWLPAQAVQATLLPGLEPKSTGTGVAARYEFLRALSSGADAQLVETNYTTRYWNTASAGDARTYHKELGASLAAARRLISTRLFSLGVSEWQDAGDALVPLAEIGAGNAAFFTKAARETREHADQRNSRSAWALETLGEHLSISAVKDGLQPAQEVPWFVWLHGNVPALRQRWLKESGIARDMFDTLERFSADHFGQMYTLAKTHYYPLKPLEETVFTRLLQPAAALRDSLKARAVLDDTTSGTWIPAHRETIALNNLAAGTGHQPAYESASLQRLDFADAVYRNLISPRSAKISEINTHIGSSLLDRLLREHLRLYREVEANEDAVEKSLQRMDPLIQHLRACARPNVDMRNCAPLRSLLEDLQQGVNEVMDQLTPGATPGTERKALVNKFTLRFKRAIRLQGALSSLVPEPKAWVLGVCRQMRIRLFELAEEHDAAWATTPGGGILRWPAEQVQSKAGLAKELLTDRDFLDLAEHTQEIGSMIFNELLLPFVRVHGLFATLYAQDADSEVYPKWLGKNRERYTQVFKALNTQESLDAKQAVFHLSSRHLRMVGIDNPWLGRAEHFFAGQWSVNADLALFKRLLHESAAPEPGTLEEGLAPAGHVPDLQALAMLALEHVPDTDLWPELPWIDHLVNAADRQRGPFRTSTAAKGNALPWKALIGSKPQALPFKFETPEPSTAPVRRSVALPRLTLLEKLVKASPNLEQWLFISRSALFLPNDAKLNNASTNPGDTITRADRLKCSLGPQLIAALDSSGLSDDLHVRILRALARLDVSFGTLPPPPALKDATTGDDTHWLPAMARIDDSRARKPDLLPALNEIVEERRRMEAERLRTEPLSEMEQAREDIDSMLGRPASAEDPGARGTLLPVVNFSSIDRPTIARQFGRRLESLNDQTIRPYLRLRRAFEKLLSKTEPSKPGDEERLHRFFALLDYQLFFSRYDFTKGNGWLPLEREGDDVKTGKKVKWWPALTLMSIITPGFLERCDHFTESVAKAGGKVHDMRLELMRLGEAECGLLKAICAEPVERADQMLDFHVRIEDEVIDLRRLCESKHEDQANAEGLASAAFAGAVQAMKQAPLLQSGPNDIAVRDRWFTRFDAGLSAQDNRDRPVACLADALSLAARCADGDKTLPAKLRDASALPHAQLLAAAPALGCRGLLGGGATPKVIAALLFELVEHGAKERPEWRHFVDAALTSEDSHFAGDMLPVLSDLFFRPEDDPPRVVGEPPVTNIKRQREGVQQIIGGWRSLLLQPVAKESDSRLARACRSQTADLLRPLMEGKVPERKECAYLLAPLDEFEKRGKQELAEPPMPFLQLVSWIESLGQPNDPQPIRRFLGTDEPEAKGGAKP